MTDKKDKILEELNASEEDMTDFATDVPTEKGTIDKNTFLINLIKDNFHDSIPEDMHGEVYDTLLSMTERKLLASSNVFSFIIANEMEETLSKLFDGIIAMHGVMVQLILKFRDEMSEELSPEHRGILNVLHFGRTNETLPTPNELRREMKEISEDVENSKSLMKKALLPETLKKAQRLLGDIQEQSMATGIYTSSENEKVIKGAINTGLLRRLFLPMKEGNGVYAVKVASRKKESDTEKSGRTMKKELKKMLDTVKDMSDDEFNNLMDKTFTKIKKEDKN